MVTHDPRAAATADRAVFLSDGRVVDEARTPTTTRSWSASGRWNRRIVAMVGKA